MTSDPTHPAGHRPHGPEPKRPPLATAEPSESRLSLIRELVDRRTSPVRCWELAKAIRRIANATEAELILDALAGPWLEVDDFADIARRQLMGHALLGWRDPETRRRPIHRLFPTGIAVITAGGKTGTLDVTHGTSLYEFHWEFPVDGFGVVKNELFHPTADGPVPLLSWLVEHRETVICPACGGRLELRTERHCPARPHRARLRLFTRDPRRALEMTESGSP